MAAIFMRFIYIFFFSISCSVVAQRYKTASSYLQFVDAQNAGVVSQTWDYMFIYTNEPTSQQTKGKLKVLENSLLKSLRNIEKDNPFDQALQQDALKYLQGNLAIVQQDYSELFKRDSNKDTSNTDRGNIFTAIRKSMLKLRTDYDTAIRNYADRHKLTVSVNNSAVANKMEQTIALYDNYHQLQSLFRKLHDADRALWENLAEIEISDFQVKERLLRTIIAENNKALENYLGFNNDTSLAIAFKTSQDTLLQTLDNNLADIKAVLKTEPSENMVLKPEQIDAFNTAKTKLNIERQEAFNSYKAAGREFLQKHINSF